MKKDSLILSLVLNFKFSAESVLQSVRCYAKKERYRFSKFSFVNASYVWKTQPGRLDFFCILTNIGDFSECAREFSMFRKFSGSRFVEHL